MPSFSKTIVVGRLTRDTELRHTAVGIAVATVGVAVDRKRKQEGRPTTDFYEVVLWQKAAETMANFGVKGRLILFDGRMEQREYEAKDGQKRRVWELIADDFQFMDSKPKEDTGEGFGGGGDLGEDLPF